MFIFVRTKLLSFFYEVNRLLHRSEYLHRKSSQTVENSRTSIEGFLMFLSLSLVRFHVYSWLFHSKPTTYLDPSQQKMMLESVLITVCAVVGFHPNIGMLSYSEFPVLTDLSISCSRNPTHPCRNHLHSRHC